MEYVIAMNDNYRGLRRVIQACQLKGLIKPFPYEGEEKLVYENRFAPFEKTPIPRYVPYEHYKQQLDKENANPNAFEQLLTEAKLHMTAASTRIGKLAATDEECRDTLNYPTEKLSKL